MTRLKLKIEIGSDNENVRMGQLGAVTFETEKFLRYLLDDLGISTGEKKWVLKDLLNNSVGYTAELPEDIDAKSLLLFNDSIETLISSENEEEILKDDYKTKTIEQLEKIGKCLGRDSMRIGIFCPHAEGNESKWYNLTRERAKKLKQIIEPIVYHGSFQGRLESWHKENQYFFIRELAYNQRIRCEYEAGMYGKLHSMYEDKDNVVHVTGMVTTNPAKFSPVKISVTEIRSYRKLSDEEFESLFGIDPEITGDDTTTEFLDKVRETR